MLPPVAHRHLIGWWLEIGPTVMAGMGEGPIGWQEIAAWQRLPLPVANLLGPWISRDVG